MMRSTTRSTSFSVTLRWRIKSAMVPILRPWRAANAARSAMRAMEPSGFMISQMTAAGVSPASSARSQPASVWPARTSTPPFCAITGKMWPGCTISSGFAWRAVAARTVRARSAAEIPVVTPLAASIEMVNAVPMGERLSFTMSASFSWRQRPSVSVRQTRPRACVAMKLIASGVTKSAASRRSPSFSRSSASASTTMRPRRMSSINSWAVCMRLFCHFAREHPLDVARDHVDLEIHARSGAELAERGRGERVRDHVHFETGAVDRVHREAHAVDADRALAREVARQRRGRFDHQPRACAEVVERLHHADAVDVAAHEVAAEPVRKAQRLLQVHVAALLESRGDRARRVRGVHVESVRVLRDHRVTDAVDRDGIADRDIGEVEAG